MLNQRWSGAIAAITSLYQELDEDVAVFAGKSGMKCPPGCGACCLSPHVECTVAEMLPLALRLFASDQVEATLERLEQGSPICVQYDAVPGHPEKGRCRTYAERPILCRLFGFIGSRDKAGQSRYGACRVQQKMEVERIAAVDVALIQGQLSIPMLGPAHERINEISVGMETEVMPINQALFRAIQIIGLDLQLQENDRYACTPA